MHRHSGTQLELDKLAQTNRRKRRRVQLQLLEDLWPPVLGSQGQMHNLGDQVENSFRFGTMHTIHEQQIVESGE